MITPENVKKSKKYKEIHASLMEQLERSGNDVPHYIDMVDDYMALYVSKELCRADVEERGVVVVSTGSMGQVVSKKNDSVEYMIKLNQQMIRLLEKLGIKPENGVPDDEEM